MAKYLMTDEEMELIREDCLRWNAKKVMRRSDSEPECGICGNKRWRQVVDGSSCMGISYMPCECQEKMKVFGYRRIWGGVRKQV